MRGMTQVVVCLLVGGVTLVSPLPATWMVEQASVVDTTRPAAPWPPVWPTGETLVVVDPARSELKFLRTVFSVFFADTASGTAVRDFMVRFSARIIGRLTELSADPNHYLIEVPDPGPEWSQVNSLAREMGTFPGVRLAGPSRTGSRVQIRSQFPLDSGVSETPSVWFLGDTGAVPMQVPNSKPPWFGDDSSWTQGGVTKWTVGLVFVSGATQAQRDAAVSRARGQVVGGLTSALGGEGLYYIRLPWAFEVDSLIAAVTLLDQQPGVKFAILLSKPQTLARPSARFNHYPVEAAIGDTSRPAAPWPGVWPEGEPLLVVDPARPDLTYERTVFDVFFDDTTSGLGVRSFMTSFSARIIGRLTELFPDPNHYLIEIPDPGSEWSQVDLVGTAMMTFPGVRLAGPSGFGSRMRLRSRFPLDSGVSETESKSGDSLSRHPMEAAIGDTSRPAAPWPGVYPEGEPLLVVDPARPWLTYQRTVLQVAFDDTTSGLGVRSFMSRFSARIIGRFTELFPDPDDYIIEIPDPGSEWSQVDSVVTAMVAFPGVQLVGPSGFGSRMRLRSRFPLDSDVSETASVWLQFREQPSSGSRPRSGTGCGVAVHGGAITPRFLGNSDQFTGPPRPVIPAKAGIHLPPQSLVYMDPRFRGDDDQSEIP